MTQTRKTPAASREDEVPAYRPPREDSPVAAEIKEDMLWVRLKDGRVIGTPLAWYPHLVEATPSERNHIQLEPFGVHWPEIDEALSIEGMLAGRQGMRWRRSQERPDFEMTVKEVAADYDITIDAVYAAIRRGTLPAIQRGGGKFVLRRDAEARWGSRVTG